MYLNNFSVRIIGGTEDPGGYVQMKHGGFYALALRNDRTVRCDARVEVDGKHVGTWRVGVQQTVTLQRPAHDHGRFTFYEVGTPEAQQAGLAVNDPNLGLVKVTFTPERAVEVRPLLPVDPPCVWGYALPVTDSTANNQGVWPGSVTYSCSLPVAAAASYSAGGTGLSGHSCQEFGTVGALDYDLSQQTVIHLRLVAKRESGEPRPLTAYSTPVPPAVR